jgi:hypothetical protein
MGTHLCLLSSLLAVASSVITIEDESSTELWLTRLAEMKRANGGAPLQIAVAGDHFTE